MLKHVVIYRERRKKSMLNKFMQFDIVEFIHFPIEIHFPSFLLFSLCIFMQNISAHFARTT